MLRPACRTAPDLNHISEESWKRAQERYAAIQPLLADKPVGRPWITLGLVVNALILWNTRYMDAALNHLKN